MFYDVDNTTNFKRLPYRASRKQLISTIEDIKKEINYYEKRKEKIKNGEFISDKLNISFAYTW